MKTSLNNISFARTEIEHCLVHINNISKGFVTMIKFPLQRITPTSTVISTNCAVSLLGSLLINAS